VVLCGQCFYVYVRCVAYVTNLFCIYGRGWRKVNIHFNCLRVGLGIVFEILVLV
jgi:hypothetical protein